MDKIRYAPKVKDLIGAAYPMIILLVCIFGASFGGAYMEAAATTTDQQQQQPRQQQPLTQQQQQQGSGTINGGGTSEVTNGVCSNLQSNDFFTIQFDASFLLSSDGKTGKVTTGTGIIKTTYSNVFGYLSITGGTINVGVQPALYSLVGTAAFQSSSSCNLPSTAKFSIANPDGTQLKCGNTDLITFNSIPLTESVTGNVDCTATTLVPAIGTTPMPPQNKRVNTHTTPPDNVNIVSATDGQGKRIPNGAINVPSKSITFQLSRPTDNVGVAVIECSIDGSTNRCPSSPSGGSITRYNDLDPGKHTFTFTAKDSAGNTSSDTFTWTTSANARH